MNPIKLTKGVKALAEVTDQTTVLGRVIKDNVLEHDVRLTAAALWIDVLEKRPTDVEEAHQLASTKMEQNRQEAKRKCDTMVEDANL